MAKDIGSHIPKEFIVFWFKKINLETYLEYLSLVCQYAKFAECEIDNDGKDYTIILSHDIGQKWSDFLVVSGDNGRLITGQNPESAMDVGENVVEMLNSS